MFADEPTGNLDADTGAEIVELMFTLNREQGTTLALSPRPDLAASCAHRRAAGTRQGGGMNLVLRFVRRELRSTGSAHPGVLALAVAVASIGAGGVFADRRRDGCAKSGQRAARADAMISSDRPLPEPSADRCRDGAQDHRIRRASAAWSRRLPKDGAGCRIGRGGNRCWRMSGGGDAVLRGAPLRKARRRKASDATAGTVQPGEVFADERLATRLAASAGDRLEWAGNNACIAQVFARGARGSGNSSSTAPVLMSGKPT